MILQTLIMQHFRLFEQVQYDFHPKLTIIIGENTRGKTSILEGVYALIFGEGFRETKEEELITWEKERCNLAASFKTEPSGRFEFQIMIRRVGDKVEKAFFVDKTKKTHYTYLQFQTRAVLFTPDNIEIITGSPSGRRHYFDKLLSAIDIDYKKRLSNYENALRKRNKVLETFRGSDENLKEELSFWDKYLEENGTYITNKRAEYASYLNAHPDLDNKIFSINHVKNILNKERLAEKFELEKRMRKTSIGPQKDDYELYLTTDVSKNVQLYGSRSEQRLAMFWLKLREISAIEEQTGKKPLLLLDDVFSELDSANKKRVIRRF
jgi:DNA replication and repair protein RecF